MVVDLFNDFRDGSKLLDLLEVMSGQRIVSPFSTRPLTLTLTLFHQLTEPRLCFVESGERQRNVSAQEQH